MASVSDSLQDRTLIIEYEYVNGQWVLSNSNRIFGVQDPAANKVIGNVPEFTVNGFNRDIQAASDAFPAWRSQSSRQRARVLWKLNDLNIDNKEGLSSIIVLKMACLWMTMTEKLFLRLVSLTDMPKTPPPKAYGDAVPH
ncbi:hypothetical protein NM208_g3379 [Fusarium decemcellulare]|uniref:Uncharacterized protein n=1 Tax=Fusarium decemcellulare TaxID=57161 RepID=A0ACC1SP78_9HYPO|nr:hypothetical protein NM208_g3379 [Fusarium decemcellulare]